MKPHKYKRGKKKKNMSGFTCNITCSGNSTCGGDYSFPLGYFMEGDCTAANKKAVFDYSMTFIVLQSIWMLCIVILTSVSTGCKCSKYKKNGMFGMLLWVVASAFLIAEYCMVFLLNYFSVYTKFIEVTQLVIVSLIRIVSIEQVFITSTPVSATTEETQALASSVKKRLLLLTVDSRFRDYPNAILLCTAVYTSVMSMAIASNTTTVLALVLAWISIICVLNIIHVYTVCREFSCFKNLGKTFLILSIFICVLLTIVGYILNGNGLVTHTFYMIGFAKLFITMGGYFIVFFN